MNLPGMVWVAKDCDSVSVKTCVVIPSSIFVSTNTQMPLPGAVMVQDSASINDSVALNIGSKVVPENGSREKALFPATRVTKDKRH